jgi:hypothetical protein
MVFFWTRDPVTFSVLQKSGSPLLLITVYPAFLASANLLASRSAPVAAVALICDTGAPVVLM